MSMDKFILGEQVIEDLNNLEGRRLCLIIPHYGSVEDLEKKVSNINEKVTSDKVDVVYSFDNDITESDKELIVSQLKDNHYFVTEYKNRGLTHARYLALEYAFKELNSRLFMFTNSDDMFDNELSDKLVRKIIAMSYKCDIQYLRVSEDHYEGDSLIDYMEVFNNTLEDLTTIFNLNDLKLYPKVEDESYFPESSFYSLICNTYCYIHEEILGRVIYSEGGMSNSYTKEFLMKNRIGFLANAQLFLTKYLKGEISLSLNKLKSLIDCIIDLGGNYDFIPKESFLMTILKSRVTNWIDTNSRIKIYKS